MYTLSHKGDAITDTSGKDFDIDNYSRFKYGCGDQTLQLATMMAGELINRYGHDLSTMYLAASPFKHVPTAAYNLLMDIVPILVDRGYAPKGLFRIDRGVVKAVDYSSLNATQRAHSNAGRQVIVPEVSRLQIAGQHVLIIDDIRVSGTTEDETRKGLSLAGVGRADYGYLAQIEQQADHSFDATIEHQLTHSTILALSDLQNLIASTPSYNLNARTCKFILRSNPEDVASFARHIPGDLYEAMMTAIIADEYHTMPEHRAAFNAFVRKSTLKETI